jgi:hypothetical protein
MSNCLPNKARYGTINKVFGQTMLEGGFRIMKCISVYTNDFEVFSDIYERILEMDIAENEEQEVEGITVCDAGLVPEDYIEKMRVRPEVVVMSIKKKGILIFQHGDVFEILVPDHTDEEIVEYEKA